MTDTQIPLMASHRSNLKGLNMSDDLELKSPARKSLLSAAIVVALAGMTGTASAAPTLFDATATVQNAVTITQVTPLTFGTVFATKSAVLSASATATTAAPLSNKLILSPAGTVTQGVVVSGGNPVLSLGGATAGSYTIPGLPAGAKIALLLTNATAVAMINSAGAVNANCGYENPTAAGTAGKITLALTGGDPASTGFFCVDALTASVAGIDLAAGTLLPTSTAFGTVATANTTGYTLAFSATSVTFNLGGTLVQQVPVTTAATPRTYEAGTYSGKIGLEVTFL
ncbi:MAG: hypothetical protein Q8O79_06740 [Pseudomonadota bacterium]|nr:hypothetical protein [Pseudomonadota bacterium]